MLRRRSHATPRRRARCPQRVVEKFGRLDVLVNSAAVMHRLDFERDHARAVRRHPRSESPLGLLLHPGRRRRAASGAWEGGEPRGPGGSAALARLRGPLGEQGRGGHADQGAGARAGPRGHGERDRARGGAGAGGVRRGGAASGSPAPRRSAGSAVPRTWSRRCSTCWKAATSSPARCWPWMADGSSASVQLRRRRDRRRRLLRHLLRRAADPRRGARQGPLPAPARGGPDPDCRFARRDRRRAGPRARSRRMG